eukprot:scaffold106580_cov17-Tisochrysis_lutea.AAC.1
MQAMDYKEQQRKGVAARVMLPKTAEVLYKSLGAGPAEAPPSTRKVVRLCSRSALRGSCHDTSLIDKASFENCSVTRANGSGRLIVGLRHHLNKECGWIPDKLRESQGERGVCARGLAVGQDGGSRLGRPAQTLWLERQDTARVGNTTSSYR